MLAYFERPGTSNGPTEAIDGRLEHLRGSALGHATPECAEPAPNSLVQWLTHVVLPIAAIVGAAALLRKTTRWDLDELTIAI